MLDNQVLDVEKLTGREARGRGEGDRLQPKLGPGTIPGDVDVGRLLPIRRVEEKAVGTGAQDGGHGGSMDWPLSDREGKSAWLCATILSEDMNLL